MSSKHGLWFVPYIWCCTYLALQRPVHLFDKWEPETMRRALLQLGGWQQLTSIWQWPWWQACLTLQPLQTHAHVSAMVLPVC